VQTTHLSQLAARSGAADGGRGDGWMARASGAGGRAVAN
jgi:hypothetical protein